MCQRDFNSVKKAAALGIAGLLVFWMSVSANAASGKTFVNVSTQFCLDSNVDGHVYTLGCNGGNYQHWTISGQRLVNVSTGKCLDSNGDGKVYTLDCNGGAFQNWVRNGRRLVNGATGKCLDSDANRDVYALGCNGGELPELAMIQRVSCPTPRLMASCVASSRQETLSFALAAKMTKPSSLGDLGGFARDRFLLGRPSAGRAHLESRRLATSPSSPCAFTDRTQVFETSRQNRGIPDWVRQLWRTICPLLLMPLASLFRLPSVPRSCIYIPFQEGDQS